MPKVEVSFESGQLVSDEWKEPLLQYLGSKQVERLERLGGRLTFALTVPFSAKTVKPKGPTFDEDEYSVLKSISSNKVELQQRLFTYDVKALRSACSALEIAVSKKTPRVELIAQIMRSLGSGATWDAIIRR